MDCAKVCNLQPTLSIDQTKRLRAMIMAVFHLFRAVGYCVFRVVGHCVYFDCASELVCMRRRRFDALH